MVEDMGYGTDGPRAQREDASHDFAAPRWCVIEAGSDLSDLMGMHQGPCILCQCCHEHSLIMLNIVIQGPLVAKCIEHR